MVKSIRLSKKVLSAQAAAERYDTKEAAQGYDPWTVEDKKDYKLEAQKIREIATKTGSHKNKTLLDIGCGTGTHLSYLEKHYDCVGVDPAQKMLNVAKKSLRKLL